MRRPSPVEVLGFSGSRDLSHVSRRHLQSVRHQCDVIVPGGGARVLSSRCPSPDTRRHWSRTHVLVIRHACTSLISLSPSICPRLSDSEHFPISSICAARPPVEHKVGHVPSHPPLPFLHLPVSSLSTPSHPVNIVEINFEGPRQT